MGIINVTPDSFRVTALLEQNDPLPRLVEPALTFVAEGADILDIGGESIMSHGATITLDEIGRILPVVRAVRAAVDVPISIDTYRAKSGRRLRWQPVRIEST